ncbi:hypothetical protein AA21952_2576 [Acetobacter oeni LMG 21952]|nr:hypothetical protein AA21952_2576 [Acetobacter oeni LMG 21952]
MGGQQAFHGFGADKRVVGVEHGDVTIAEQVFGLKSGMGGAKAIMLYDGGVGGGEFRNIVHVGTDYDDDLIKDAGGAGDEV